MRDAASGVLLQCGSDAASEFLLQGASDPLCCDKSGSALRAVTLPVGTTATTTGTYSAAARIATVTAGGCFVPADTAPKTAGTYPVVACIATVTTGFGTALQTPGRCAGSEGDVLQQGFALVHCDMARVTSGHARPWTCNR